MARPKKIDRPLRKNLSIPESLAVRIDLILYSPLEGRVPAGAWSELVENLLQEHIVKLEFNRSKPT